MEIVRQVNVVGVQQMQWERRILYVELYNLMFALHAFGLIFPFYVPSFLQFEIGKYILCHYILNIRILFVLILHFFLF